MSLLLLFKGNSSAGNSIGLLLALTYSGSSSTQTLFPTLLINTNVFYSEAVSVGPVNLTPSLFTNTNTFFTETVTPTYFLLPSLFTNTNTFFTETVTSKYTLSSSLFTNTNVFNTDVLTTKYTLLPNLFTNTNVFYSATETQNQRIFPLYFTGQGHIIPFHTIKQIYNEPPGDFDRWKFPYTSKDSTVNTGTFRKRNTAFGPRKTTF